MGNGIGLEMQCMSSLVKGGEDDEASIFANFETSMFPVKIGEGQFSRTFTCWRRGCPEDCYALKVYNSDSEQGNDAVGHAANEVLILRTLGCHPRIVELIDCDQDENVTRLHIVQELCEGGTLYDKLVEKGHYEESEGAVVIRQILQACEFMHSKGVMHRDLKPENILLVSNDNDIDIKVCDFGISKMATEGDVPRSRSFTGSAHYVAPEMIRQEDYGPEIDVWAVGVISYALLSGSLPFTGQGGELVETYRAIVAASPDFTSKAWKEFKREPIKFVKALLNESQLKRPTAAAAIRMPWILSKGYQVDDPEYPEDINSGRGAYAGA